MLILLLTYCRLGYILLGYLKSQGVLQANILSQRGSADQMVVIIVM